MPQGKDDGAAGASFTISEWSGDTNQTFELDSEDIPPNFDTQTWEWVEFLPELSLKPEKRLHRKALEIVAAGQFIFGNTLAPNGEFPRWLPETTVLNTIREIQFLCGHDSENVRELSPEQIKTYMDADDNSTIVPDGIATRPFFKAINQLQHCRYVLSLGRERGLVAINAPGVIRTKRDRENSLGMVEHISTRLEFILEDLSPVEAYRKFEAANISEETLQRVHILVQRPENEFRFGMLEFPNELKREFVIALDGNIENAVCEVRAEAKLGRSAKTEKRLGAKKRREMECIVKDFILNNDRKNVSASQSEKLIRQKVFGYAKTLRVDSLFKNADPTKRSDFIYRTLLSGRKKK